MPTVTVGDVGIELFQLAIQAVHFVRHLRHPISNGLFFHQGRTGEIIALPADRKFGPVGPVGFFTFKVINMPAQFLAIGNTFGRGGADFHQGVFHFLDHEPDDLFRIFGFFQYGIDIGIYDVAESGKNTHLLCTPG
jgi:hypothetical protein